MSGSVRGSGTAAVATGMMLSAVLFIAPGTSLQAAAAENGAPKRLWSDSGRLTNQAIEALGVLAQAPAHGLPANRYAINRLSQLAIQLPADNNEVLFNELLTAAIETYALDLMQGMQPSAFKDKRDRKPVKTSGHTLSSQLQAAVLKGLHRSVSINRVANFIASIEPIHPDYAALQAALADHQKLAALGGWPYVSQSATGQALKPGESDPSIPALRQRLAVAYPALLQTTGHNAYSAHRYDQTLEFAVMAFQARHGLTADGRVGKHTLALMNVSVDERIEQLKLNLDRWRLMPKVLPKNHIWVNVPAYNMKLQLDREEVLNMRVVVGKTSSPTPMMDDVLEHLVFSPYWNLPQKIAVGEILPQIKADPNYLSREGFEVMVDNRPIDASGINWQNITASNMPYWLRQRPGKTNALGRVKFIFPNHYAVYLHDSPEKDLFDNSTRTLSHGCVRLEDPAALASALLHWDRGWQPEKVSAAMAGTQQKYVKLKQQVPVYLVYFTATVENGSVKFHQDIYGHDSRHKAAQSQAAPTLVAQVLARHAKVLAVLDAGQIAAGRIDGGQNNQQLNVQGGY